MVRFGALGGRNRRGLQPTIRARKAGATVEKARSRGSRLRAERVGDLRTDEWTYRLEPTVI
jgi:hypothetical protein